MNKAPKLRFKEFSDEWKIEPLNKLGTFFKGSGLSKSDLSDEGSTCILYGELYTKYTEVIRDVKSKTNVEGTNFVIGQANDVLIPSSGEKAIDIATASCLQQDDVILGGDLNVFRSNQINGIFASYQLNTSKKFEIAKLAQGASVVHVYNEQLKKLKLSVPTIAEQEKIASFFSLIDKKIELQTEKVEGLKKYKSGMMQKMFPKDGETVPELRFAGFTDAWEQRKLGEVVTLFGGNAFSSKNSVSSGARWLKIANVGTGQLKWNEKSFLPISYLDEYSTYRLKVGDFVMALTRPILNHELKVAGIAWDDILLNQRVAKLIFMDDDKFGYQLLRKRSTVDMIENELAGTDPPNLSVNTLNNIDVRIPNLVEQERIGTFFSNLDTLITLHQRKLEAFNDLKKSLLQQMFI